MPTAVESYTKLGAVIVQLPSSTSVNHVNPNDTGNIGGRNSTRSASTLQHVTPTGLPPHTVVSNNADNGSIGGRSGGGAGVVSIHNPHLKTPPVHATPSVNLTHKTSAHHPAPVHLKPLHPTPGNIDSTSIPGRSGTGLLPAVQNGGTQVAGRGHVSTLLPAVQPVPTGPSEEATLRPLLAEIGSALQGALPPGQRSIEALGIGTDGSTLRVLIALLRTQGYHVTVAACDGSVRPGFSGPSAVLRGHGGATPGQFLQELAAARIGH